MVTAVNAGGESFPSEILSVCRVDNNKPEVLIVNGFDRLSAPASYVYSDSAAGFNNDEDAGMPYIRQTGFVGNQYEFNRTSLWESDKSPGFGASLADAENTVIAGNTFDYPFVHGKAIKAAGFSFVSCSKTSALCGDIDLKNYKIIDLILGNQKQSQKGNGKKSAEFKTFALPLQQILMAYCGSGGNLFVSGSHIASDFYIKNYINAGDKHFIQDVLHYKLLTDKGSYSAEVKTMETLGNDEISYHSLANEESYYAARTDAIMPTGANAQTVCRYEDTKLGAGTVFQGNYKVCAMSFPFETIKTDRERNKLMRELLNFFTK
jgi:hypothetical protein